MNTKVHIRANEILKDIYGKSAEFREGQYEAIEAVLTRKRTIVVQKTGWGKSLVYFISARMISELQRGSMTIIISPLLVLMDNQMNLAKKAGLQCAALNSRVKGKAREIMLEDLTDGRYNLLFTTPETMYSKDVQEIVKKLNIGLFVVDECHCISDWGHDFRLEYGKLHRIIEDLPDSVSVLGTTATANDRVIADLKKQFGDDVYVSRGPLSRENLHIEVLHIEDKSERYAWLKENLNKLPGSGIVYCLTKRDCKNLSDFLCDEGITARPYYSGKELEEENIETGVSYNEETEKLFKENKIKVIVATIKLGMGYDKEDIRFVIHFQQPGSLVAYYQQIGRAGRKEGMDAYCYLMVGKNDRKISEYFIENAFPTEAQEREIIDALDNSEYGLTRRQLDQACNISGVALNKTINMLLNQNVIYQEGGKYFRSVNLYRYDGLHYESVKKAKYQELNDLYEYVNINTCYSKYVVNNLNDYSACDCGKCANCIKNEIFVGAVMPKQEQIEKVKKRLNSLYIPIEPRKQWIAKTDLDANTRIAKPNEIGIALAKYNDSGFGEMVAYDKYHALKFRSDLVDKAVAVLKEMNIDKEYTVITNVPSKRNNKVEIFAKELADKLGIKYESLLKKRLGESKQQKEMQNSYYQCTNVLESIELVDEISIKGNIILVDDMVDSKWTLTVCGRLLTNAGAEKVFPFCLADSSRTGEDS